MATSLAHLRRADAPAYVARVAAFAHAVRLDALPAPVLDHARLIVLDTLGVIVAGSQEEPVRRLVAGLAPSAPGAATVPGTRSGMPAPLAAFVNGTAGTWNEQDEGNYPTNGHPAIHVVPAALALAEELDRSGAELLRAVIAGYEVGGRLGIATTFRDAVMHPHGTHGTVGGALACGTLLGLTPERLGALLCIASSMTVATSRPTVFEGATVRNSYAGQGNQNAVLAARLAAAGFTGERDGLGSVFGRVSGEAFDPDRFVAGLGTDFILLRNYFKFHACCAYNHATLEALGRALAGRRLRAEDVASIDIATYFPATRMSRTDVDNPLASKFSLPYAVAAMLVLGSCARESFIEPALSDPRLRALMPLVTIREDPAATAAYPAKQQAAVRIALRDGSRLDAAVDTVRGDHANPVAPAEVVGKFVGLASPVLGAAQAARVVELVERLGKGTGARELGAALRVTS